MKSQAQCFLAEAGYAVQDTKSTSIYHIQNLQQNVTVNINATTCRNEMMQIVMLAKVGWAADAKCKKPRQVVGSTKLTRAMKHKDRAD